MNAKLNLLVRLIFCVLITANQVNNTTINSTPPQSLSIHSTFAIFILSTRPRKMTVDMFPQKKNPGIQATLRRLSEYPEALYFKAIYTIYFCTFDSNTTVSTVLPFSHKSRLTSCPSRYIGKLNSIDFKGISDSPLGYI